MLTALATLGVLLLPVAAEARSKTAAHPHEKSVVIERSGPYAIRSLEFSKLKDTRRKDRPVGLKLHLPRYGGPYPLVIISHGAGGVWDSHLYQAEYLASHGYAVVCVEHVDSSSTSVKFYMSRAGGGESMREAMQRITTDAVAVLERPGDIRFAIDTLVAWNKSHKELAGRINTGKIAVMGHSFGAYTAMAVAGARPIVDHLKPRIGLGKGLAAEMGDSRVTFALAMSPPGPGSKFFGPESYRSIKRPLILLSGSRDEQKGPDGRSMPAETRREILPLLPSGNRSLIWMANAEHVAFTDNPSMWLIPSPSRRDVQRISKALMLAACDYYLKGRNEARRLMKSKHLGNLRGEVVTSVELLEK